MKKRLRLPVTCSALEWVEEASGVKPRVLLSGGNSAMIENLTEIIEFSPERIRLMTRCGLLTLKGNGLTLCQVRPDALTISGCIAAIELPISGSKDPMDLRAGEQSGGILN